MLAPDFLRIVIRKRVAGVGRTEMRALLECPEDGLGQLRLAGTGVPGERDVADLVRRVNLHKRGCSFVGPRGADGAGKPGWVSGRPADFALRRMQVEDVGCKHSPEPAQPQARS